MLFFLGIGAQKAGTTWLYSWLATHPQLGFPAGKEARFWNRRGERDLAGYTALFADPNRREGELTPAYAVLDEPTVRSIRGAFPDLRLIYILRDPVERAWSQACMELARAGLDPNAVPDRWFLDRFHAAGSMARNDYAAAIKCWGGIFGRSALLVLRYEDIVSDPRGLLCAVSRHLGVETGHWSRFDTAELARSVHSGPHWALPDRFRPILRSLVARPLRDLAGLVDFDVSGWAREREPAGPMPRAHSRATARAGAPA